MNANHPRTLRHGFVSQGKFLTTNLRRMPARIRIFVTPFVDGIVENKGKHMPNDLIHRKPKNKTQTSQLALTNTSPSPIWGSWKGVPMPHDQAYYKAEKKIEQALKSDATELPIRHPFICSLSVENKGGHHAT